MTERQTFHCGAEVMPILRTHCLQEEFFRQQLALVTGPLFGIDIFEEPDFPEHYFEIRKGADVLLTGFIEAGNGSRT